MYTLYITYVCSQVMIINVFQTKVETLRKPFSIPLTIIIMMAMK